jgi:ACT domain-containing protein
MNEIKQAARLNTALQVMERTHAGMKVKDACQAVGLPKSSFYYILAQNEKAVAELQEQLIGDVRVRLANIIGNRLELLEKVSADALDDKTKPRDRLAILKYLDSMMDKITQKLSIDNSAEMDASEFLGKIKLSIQKSRMTAYASEGEDEG